MLQCHTLDSPDILEDEVLQGGVSMCALEVEMGVGVRSPGRWASVCDVEKLQGRKLQENVQGGGVSKGKLSGAETH